MRVKAGDHVCGGCGAVLAAAPAPLKRLASLPPAMPRTQVLPELSRPLTAAGTAFPISDLPVIPAPKVRYGGFWRRFGAFLLDTIILVSGEIVLFFLAGFVFSMAGASVDGLVSVGIPIFEFLGPWVYYAGLESSPLQATLGKLAFGMVVTNERGVRLSFARATGRYWAKTLSGLTLFIGYLMAAFTARKQALHDKVAGTLVVIEQG